MREILQPVLLISWIILHVDATMTKIDVSMDGALGKTDPERDLSDPFERLEHFREYTREEKIRRKDRMKERRMRAQEVFEKLPQPSPGQLERLTDEEVSNLRKRERDLNWFNSNVDVDPYSASILADPSQEYDKWAQAYRMLGGFIDCDHKKTGKNHHSQDNKNQNNDNKACSRWMMWAAYVNPNYQGNEYDEYFGDQPTSVLDCHSPDTEWKLLGVYRQEFYQYIEQISKHLWAINEYEYIVALAGLAYMTDADCFQVDKDGNGNPIYAGVAPQPYGKFKMALYTDEYCLTPNQNLGKTFDDYNLQSAIDLGSKDKTDDDTYAWAYDDWYNSQEYTLTNLNNVYEEFKYCTTCVDYPTYQDGYFIGDKGTDDDDLINQCWKFYSHNSYTCEAECIAMAHAQGTILSLKYGDTTFGKATSGFYQHVSDSVKKVEESPMARLLANAFLTSSFLLFVATFLAFAVARRSRYRESRGARSRRLLDDDDGARSRRSRRSKSRATEGDGIFKSSASRKSSRTRKSSRSTSKSKSRQSTPKSSYEPPSYGGRPDPAEGESYL